MNIQPRPFDHPDAVKLNDLVQLEYAERYGDEGDVTPLDATMFDPPHGLYLLAYDEQDRPLATGGWRSQERNAEGYSDGDAEIKRILTEAHEKARQILRDHRDVLDRLSARLLEKEVVEADELKAIMLPSS